ncbi:unnamed protein product, partial [Rotaria sp. Silwood1]
CWTGAKTDLLKKWEQQYQQPYSPVSNLTVLHYNIRSFNKNQCDLIDMVEKYKPTVISINELGKEIPTQVLAKSLFSYDIFKATGTNPHGGAVLAIEKQLKGVPIDCQQKPNIIAASMLVNNKHITITSVYSPLTQELQLEHMSTILKISPQFLRALKLRITQLHKITRKRPTISQAL